MTKLVRISYAFVAATILLVGLAGLGAPFVAVLFSFLLLKLLCRFSLEKKWLSVLLFLIMVVGIFYGFVVVVRQTIHILPNVADQSIPQMIEYLHSHHLDAFMPFDDLESLRDVSLEAIKGQVGYLANFAKVATKEFVFMIIALVVAISIFLNSELDLGRGQYRKSNNLYSAFCLELQRRFTAFYESFAKVLGAQLVISSINTFFTAIFLLLMGIPHATIVIVLTFICGLLPIVGNLISNTIIVGIAITISPRLAVWALVFLVGLHKLEYFLNSKIIGSRIKNPMWLTLLGLVIGEKLLGIPGMILAPVVLHYIKSEASEVEYGDAMLPSSP